jgi:hypothetical protein
MARLKACEWALSNFGLTDGLFIYDIPISQDVFTYDIPMPQALPTLDFDRVASC